MRKAARAIVIRDDKMLVMKRNKFGFVYYVLLGGEIDMGETAEHAVVREIKEEASFDIANPRLVFIEEAGNPFGTQYIYLCDLVNGDEPKLDPKSIETAIQAMGKNFFEPMWIELADLPDLPFRSQTLKESLLEALKNGFPKEPQTIISREDIRYTKEVKN